MKKLITTTLLSLSLVVSLYADMEDNPLLYKITLDTVEMQYGDEDVFSWDTNAWIGYDLNKIYIYSEGEKPEDGLSESENQLLFSHTIAPYWDIQYGIGYDKADDAHQTWAVLALQGLAPYFFETRAAFLVGEDGNLGLRFSTEYEALLTQRLILTPSFETELYTKDTPKIEIGKGLANITAGLRLRYEVVREFAPYIGVEWSKNFGNTDNFHSLDETYLTAGFRIWF